MKGYFAISALLTAGYLVFLTGYTNAYASAYFLNTLDGFCDTEKYGRLPVGETVYNDDPCEKITCSSSSLTVTGCQKVFVPGLCHVLKGTGNFPACCPVVKCGRDAV